MSEITQKWVELLVPFTTNYAKKFTGTELASLSNIPQQSASRHLINLTNDSMLSFDIQGANKLFYLDAQNFSTKILLEIIENSKLLSFSKYNLNLINELQKVVNLSKSDSRFENSKNLGKAKSIIIIGEKIAYKKKLISSDDFELIFVNFSQGEIKKINSLKFLNKSRKTHFFSSEDLFLTMKKNMDNLDLNVQLNAKAISNHIILGDVSSNVKLLLEVFR